MSQRDSVMHIRTDGWRRTLAAFKREKERIVDDKDTELKRKSINYKEGESAEKKFRLYNCMKMVSIRNRNI